MHSTVDASSFQRNQNFLPVFLYPSRVGDDYGYRTGLAQNTAQDLCPLVRFSYASRALDASPAKLALSHQMTKHLAITGVSQE